MKQDTKVETWIGEIWKDIIGYESYYQISNYGRLKSLARPIVGRPRCPQKERIIRHEYIGKSGHYLVMLSKDGDKETALVHRLVALHFVPTATNKKHVKHINGIKTDNRAENLEYGSLRSVKVKRVYKNDNAYPFKLKEENVTEIKHLLSLKVKGRTLAKMFNVSVMTISMIKNNKSWTNISINP